MSLRVRFPALSTLHLPAAGGDATADGVTATATASAVAGAAAAASTAAGVTSTATASAIAGTASAASTAAGVTSTATTSATAGAAAAASDAAGVTATATASVPTAGAAEAASAAAGVTATATASAIPGDPAADSEVGGVTATATTSSTVGTAYGASLDATADGVTTSAAASAIAGIASASVVVPGITATANAIAIANSASGTFGRIPSPRRAPPVPAPKPKRFPYLEVASPSRSTPTDDTADPWARAGLKGNTILTPPRRSGNADTDVASLYEWVTDLHGTLAVESNIIGTTDALVLAMKDVQAKLPGATFGSDAMGLSLDAFAAANGYVLDRTGATNMAPLLNAAIEYCAARGIPLFVGPGDYRCAQSIYLRSGLKLICSKAAEFRAYFGTSQASALVTVPSVIDAITPATRERGIYIEGGVWGLAGAFNESGVWVSDFTCVTFNVYADDIHFERVEVNGYGQGRGFQLAGDRVTGRGCNCYNAVQTGGAGGVRYIGGRFFRWYDSYVEAGDDCFQLVPGGTVGANNWNNLTIEDAFYINCTGYSHTARVLVVALESNATPQLMTNSIKNFGFIACKGRGGGSSLTIQLRDSSGVIEDGEFYNCTIDDDGNEDRPMAVSITHWDTGGTSRIKNLRFWGLEVKRCHKMAVATDGAIDGLYFFGGHFEKPRVSGLNAFRVRGAYGGGIFGAVIEGDGTLEPLLIGAADATSTSGQAVRRTCANFRVRDNTISEIPDDQFGIQLVSSDDVQVTGNVLKKLTGATTARAIFFHSTSANCWADRNDFRECGHATPITDSGTGNALGTNLGIASTTSGETTSTQSAATGTLAWATLRTLIRISVAGTVTSISGTPTGPAWLTLRAVHTSGTLTIQHGSTTIRLKSSTDVVLAQNDTLLLRYDNLNGYWFEVARTVA